MKSTNEDLIEALRVLAYHIESDDGVANACIDEAADRIEELTKKPEPEPIIASIFRNQADLDLAEALRVLSQDVFSYDKMALECTKEAADRIESLAAQRDTYKEALENIVRASKHFTHSGIKELVMVTYAGQALEEYATRPTDE